PLAADPARITERLDRWNKLLQEVVQRSQQYHVPLILLRKETPKEAVCQVFEKVNTGGVSLTVFEPLTATFPPAHYPLPDHAADACPLRGDGGGRGRRLRQRKAPGSVENTEFPQAVTLLATRDRRLQSLDAGTPPESAPGVSCKRKDVLRLELADYRGWAEPL